jgi:hypothetical protein
MAEPKALGFFLSISVQHLSFHHGEEFPLEKKKKKPFPSQAMAGSIFTLWHSKGGDIFSGYLPKVMLPFLTTGKDIATEWTIQ